MWSPFGGRFVLAMPLERGFRAEKLRRISERILIAQCAMRGAQQIASRDVEDCAFATRRLLRSFQSEAFG